MSRERSHDTEKIKECVFRTSAAINVGALSTQIEARVPHEHTICGKSVCFLGQCTGKSLVVFFLSVTTGDATLPSANPSNPEGDGYRLMQTHSADRPRPNRLPH